MVATLEQIFSEEWGRVLATLFGVLGDFDLTEDAAQEAFAMWRISGHATAFPASRAPG